MEGNYIKDNLESIFENFKNMISVETVVGEAVHIGDATLVPFVDVTFGFGTGGYTGDKSVDKAKGGGGAGGAKLEPTAILVIKGERVEMFSIKGGARSSGFEKLIGMVPDIITKMKKEKYVYLNDEDGEDSEYTSQTPQVRIK